VDAHGGQQAPDRANRRKRRVRRGPPRKSVFCLWLPLLLLSANQRLPSGARLIDRSSFCASSSALLSFPLQFSSPSAFLTHPRPQILRFVQRQLSRTLCLLRRVSPGMSANLLFHISLLRAPVYVATTTNLRAVPSDALRYPHHDLSWNLHPFTHCRHLARLCGLYFRSDLM
jgi:hypothetical protein